MDQSSVLFKLINKQRRFASKYKYPSKMLAKLGLWYVNKQGIKYKTVPDRPTIISKDELKLDNLEIINEQDIWDEYLEFCKKADYPINYFGGERSPKNAFGKKSIEHYLALKLSLKENWKTAQAKVLDVGANKPTFRQAAINNNKNLDVYCVDISFPAGINGYMVGVDGKTIPFDDNSIDVIALNCAYEEFEGNSDIDFLKEANRLLKKGGKVVINPLYLSNRFIEIFDPFDFLFEKKFRGNKIEFSNRAELHAIENYGHRFVRYYDWDSVKNMLKDFSFEYELKCVDAPKIIQHPFFIELNRWVLLLTKI